MNKINKLFLLSFVLISSKSFGMDCEEAMIQFAQMHHEMDRAINRCFEEIKNENNLVDIKTENVKKDDTHVFITVKINIEDPDKNLIAKVADNKLNIDVNGKETTLKILIQDNFLNYSVKQEVKKEEKKEKDNQVFTSYTSSCICKRFSLPASVNVEMVDLSYKDGVLTITLPKKESVKKEPKRIKVEIK
ncbi:Hsp20 family protein [Candidatus Dependentiae bacterium]|nr:Hsp20 family protein [Candidatus Dependentiae bacterium]